MEQTVIQIGNSQGILLPKQMREKIGVKKGQKINIEYDEMVGGVVVRSAKSKKTKKVDVEFKAWLEMFLKENSGILDELAIR